VNKPSDILIESDPAAAQRSGYPLQGLVPQPFYDADGVTLYCGDALSVLAALGKVDAIVTDPPFAFAGGASNGRNSQSSSQFFEHWLVDVFGAMHAASVPASPWFLWSDWRSVDSYQRALGRANIGRSVDQVIIHDREKIGMGRPFRSSVDWICYVAGDSDGVAARVGTSQPNCIRHEWYYGNHPNHDAEKSVTFAERLVRWASEPGQTILDAFAGSGTTLIAARNCGRRAVGIESNERLCEVITRRLTQGSLRLGNATS
jgi:site-specific DNA-methyltransferase (adenine-specific)